MAALSLAALWLARIALGLGLALLALLVLALVLLLLALVLPFRFSGRWSRPRASPEQGDGDGAPAYWQLHVQWGGPLLQADLGSEGGGFLLRLLGRALSQRAQGRGRRGGSHRPGRSARAHRAPRRGDGGASWREWLNRGVWEQGVLLLKRLWRSLHLEFQGDLVLGLEDPSLTGMLAAARAVPPWGVAPDLHLTLDFSRPVLEGWVEARGHGSLAGMTWALLQALFSRPVRRIWTGQIRRSIRRMLRRRPRPLQGRQTRPVT